MFKYDKIDADNIQSEFYLFQSVWNIVSGSIHTTEVKAIVQ